MNFSWPDMAVLLMFACLGLPVLLSAHDSGLIDDMVREDPTLIAPFSPGSFGPDSNAPELSTENRSAPGLVSCGHCHEDDHPTEPEEMVHQMTAHFPKDYECLAEGGHPLHDCGSGDGTSWTPGACDSHDPCEPELVFIPASFAAGTQSAQVFVVANCSSPVPDGPKYGKDHVRSGLR